MPCALNRVGACAQGYVQLGVCAAGPVGGQRRQPTSPPRSVEARKLFPPVSPAEAPATASKPQARFGNQAPAPKSLLQVECTAQVMYTNVGVVHGHAAAGPAVMFRETRAPAGVRSDVLFTNKSSFKNRGGWFSKEVKGCAPLPPSSVERRGCALALNRRWHVLRSKHDAITSVCRTQVAGAQQGAAGRAHLAAEERGGGGRRAAVE